MPWPNWISFYLHIKINTITKEKMVHTSVGHINHEYQCITSKRNQNWKIWHHGLTSKLNHTFFDLAQPWKSYNNLFPFLESQQERKNENCSFKCHLKLSQLRGGIVSSWINCINIFLVTPFTLSKIFHPNTKLRHMHEKQMPPIMKNEGTMIHFTITMVKNEGWKLISL